MEKRSQVKLVSYNINNMEICASAARISTTPGNAFEIFEKAKDNEKNQELIQKVLSSGHKSIIEHVVFTLALRDVSAFVEQFFIECRLASFTVKSRRYVDFSKLGYYIPSGLDGENREQYCRYMEHMFGSYKLMLENGIPKEDARFLLPYSFHSNFYCTVNARELTHIIYHIRCGHGRGIPELQDLAGQIIEQVKSVFPCMDFEAEAALTEGSVAEHSLEAVKVTDELSLIEPEKTGAVSLLSAPADPAGILQMAYSLNHSGTDGDLDIGSYLKTGRLRELEQLSYSFLISDITLSGITHIVRHRMQSVMIPPIQRIEHSKFIVPATIRNDARLSAIYKDILETSNKMVKKMSENENLKSYSYYYALSGNVMDIMTTVNARELMHFIRLRACKRAQWEVRNISVEMLEYIRASFPELFNYFGPSCFVSGKCPEGRMTCGKMKEVIEAFSI